MVQQSPGRRFGLCSDPYAQFYPSHSRNSPVVADTAGIHNTDTRQQGDESSHNQPPVRQTLFQALGITEWVQHQPADN